MKVPEGYAIEKVLSPGPVTLVALATRARGPGGEACVVKIAAIERAIPIVRNEQAILRALAEAGVGGVPVLRDAWEEGLALAPISMPTMRELGDAIRAQSTLRDAVAIQAFRRLSALHGAVLPNGVPLDVVHGDLSPDNVFVAPDGSDAIVADFGLARWKGGGLPVDGAFRGTPLYAPPEAARGEALDGRADDFALAASILHVATGVPLRAEAQTQAAALLNAGTSPLDASHPWRTLALELFSPAIASALLACLAFDPRDRPRETPRPC